MEEGLWLKVLHRVGRKSSKLVRAWKMALGKLEGKWRKRLGHWTSKARCVCIFNVMFSISTVYVWAAYRKKKSVHACNTCRFLHLLSTETTKKNMLIYQKSSELLISAQAKFYPAWLQNTYCLKWNLTQKRKFPWFASSTPPLPHLTLFWGEGVPAPTSNQF